MTRRLSAAALLTWAAGVALIAASASHSAHAALTQLTGVASLSAGVSTLTFPTVGASTSAGSSVAYTTADNRLTFTGSSGELYNETVGATYFGSAFADGVNLLYAGSPNNGPSGPLTLEFDAPIGEFGFSLENYVFGDYTVSFAAYDGATLLGTLLADGNSPDRLAFVAARVAAGEQITRIVVSSTPSDSGSLPDSFGIGPVSYALATAVQAEVPEPGSLALAAVALLAARSLRRR